MGFDTAVFGYIFPSDNHHDDDHDHCQWQFLKVILKSIMNDSQEYVPIDHTFDNYDGKTYTFTLNDDIQLSMDDGSNKLTKISSNTYTFINHDIDDFIYFNKFSLISNQNIKLGKVCCRYGIYVAMITEEGESDSVDIQTMGNLTTYLKKLKGNGLIPNARICLQLKSNCCT